MDKNDNLDDTIKRIESTEFLQENITPTKTIEKIKHNKEIRWEFYKESVYEMVDYMDSILFTMKKDKKYKILLKVKMNEPIFIRKSKYKFPKKRIILNEQSNIYTKDMYMILNIKCNETVLSSMNDKDRKIKIMQFIPDIMNFINYNTHSACRTTDFIVLAISDDSNYKTNFNEFINALIYKNYELFNILNIHSKNIDTSNINTALIHKSQSQSQSQMGLCKMVTSKLLFQLYLPIYDIYNIFLDVYNNSVFVSKKYSIDKDNNEFWNSKNIIDY